MTGYRWARPLLLIAAAATAAAAASSPPATYAPVECAVWVEGTSTLHDWRVESEEIEGRIHVPPELLSGEAPAADVAAAVSARASIPAGSLESGKDKMDSLMHRALEAEEHPRITYRLESIELLGRAGGALRFATTGQLTIAGRTRPLTMDVLATVTEGRLVVEATTELRMTDFGIEPPTALLGTVRTGDEVRVGFRWSLAVRPSEPEG